MTSIAKTWIAKAATLALAVLIAFGALGLGGALTPTKAEAKTSTQVTQTTKKATKKKATKKKAIGKKKAISIALKNAGFKKSQVKRLKAHVDREDGRKVYEVEFVKGGYEYDYEIGYYTGKILDKDVDRDDD